MTLTPDIPDDERTLPAYGTMRAEVHAALILSIRLADYLTALDEGSPITAFYRERLDAAQVQYRAVCGLADEERRYAEARAVETCQTCGATALLHHCRRAGHEIVKVAA